MPCAPSPPSTFCHDQVTTSSLSHGISIANTAEVASQMARPSRSAAIQSPFGHFTPDVVPFQVNTTSRFQSTCDRSGILPYSALKVRKSEIFSWFLTSATQPLPKLSHASMSTPRSPSSDHIAISIAPVSEAGTMPSTYPSGMPRIFLLRSITSASFALPILARCERPSAAPCRASRDQPGRLAQGPDEKQGLLGF